MAKRKSTNNNLHYTDTRGRRCCDGMVVGLTITCAINANHH
jgi:hypothetical protein